jgi:glycosyltransferase involved in cell wall biosynthesis
MKYGIQEMSLGKFGDMIIKLSIISPCFNEAENVESCARELKEVMSLKLPEVSYEHIFIDNNSTDETVQLIENICTFDKRVKLLVNSKNVGGLKSIYLALRESRGEAIIPMLPADLQDPVEVIEDFYRLWEKGNLIVYGVRKNRKENVILRNIRKLYYRIIQSLANNYIPLNAGEFLLADKKIIKSILDLNDHQPYIRGMIAATGAKSTAVEYFMKERKKGKSSNNLVSLVDIAINGLISTSRIPARIILIIGFIISSLSIVFGVGVVFQNLFFSKIFIFDLELEILILIFFSGLQMFFLGLIGEYVLSIHSQVRGEPESFFTRKINFENINHDL